MKKTLIRVLTIIMVLSLPFSLAKPVGATDLNHSGIDGMDAFFYLTSNGTIGFDTTAAFEAGYTEAAVTQVSNRLEFMNGLVVSGEAYINENFSAVMLPNARTPRAQIVHNWDGSTDVFLTESEANTILEALELASLHLDYMSVIGELSPSIQSYVAAACLGGYISIAVQQSQINSAISMLNNQNPYVVMHIFYVEGMQATTYYAGDLP